MDLRVSLRCARCSNAGVSDRVGSETESMDHARGPSCLEMMRFRFPRMKTVDRAAVGIKRVLAQCTETDQSAWTPFVSSLACRKNGINAEPPVPCNSHSLSLSSGTFVSSFSILAALSASLAGCTMYFDTMAMCFALQDFSRARQWLYAVVSTASSGRASTKDRRDGILETASRKSRCGPGM